MRRLSWWGGSACSSSLLLRAGEWRVATWRVHLLHPAFSVSVCYPGGRADGRRQCMAGSLFTWEPTDHGPALLLRSNGPWMHAHGARPPTHLPSASGAAATKTGCPAVHATGTGSVATGTGTALTPWPKLSTHLTRIEEVTEVVARLPILEEMDGDDG